MSTDAAAFLRPLLAALEEELPAAVALRERLHSTPELAHAEHETSSAVAEALAALPVERVAGTGLLVRMVGVAGKAVALRAELDAVPVREETGASFAASGDAMHACGHDVHTAALVAVLRAIGGLDQALPRPFVALFQPSEEAYPSGAVELLEAGALNDVEAVATVHVHPEVTWGAVAVDEGPVNASSDTFAIVMVGSSGHAAYPHRASDPVVALAAVIVAAQTLVSRRLDPLRSAVVTFATLTAGSAENVIPSEARALGTLRALDPDDRLLLRQELEALMGHVAAAHGCTARVEWTEGEPAIVNDPELVASVHPLLESAGLERAPALRSCGADDFGFFSASARLLLLFAGIRGAPGVADVPLHHPRFLPPNEAVAVVARTQALALAAASFV